jgi:hypothetical protein
MARPGFRNPRHRFGCDAHRNCDGNSDTYCNAYSNTNGYCNTHNNANRNAIYTHTDSNSNPDSNSDWYTNCDSHIQSNADAEGSANTTAASHSCTAPVAAKNIVRSRRDAEQLFPLEGVQKGTR